MMESVSVLFEGRSPYSIVASCWGSGRVLLPEIRFFFFGLSKSCEVRRIRNPKLRQFLGGMTKICDLGGVLVDFL